MNSWLFQANFALEQRRFLGASSGPNNVKCDTTGTNTGEKMVGIDGTKQFGEDNWRSARRIALLPRLSFLLISGWKNR